MRRDVRKQLLADYAVALVAERESWARLREPDLAEAERCRTLAEWKQIAAGLRTLARQLREAPVALIAAEPQSHEQSHAAPASAHQADEWETESAVEAAAVQAAAATTRAPRRPAHVHCLAIGVRLAAALRAKLETAVPRLGSL